VNRLLIALNVLRGRPVLYRIHFVPGDAIVTIVGTPHISVAECEFSGGTRDSLRILPTIDDREIKSLLERKDESK